MLLDESYYNPYKNGIMLVALYKILPNLFLSWMKFSSKSDKFSYNDIPEY